MHISSLVVIMLLLVAGLMLVYKLGNHHIFDQIRSKVPFLGKEKREVKLPNVGNIWTILGQAFAFVSGILRSIVANIWYRWPILFSEENIEKNGQSVRVSVLNWREIKGEDLRGRPRYKIWHVRFDVTDKIEMLIALLLIVFSRLIPILFRWPVLPFTPQMLLVIGLYSLVLVNTYDKDSPRAESVLYFVLGSSALIHMLTAVDSETRGLALIISNNVNGEFILVAGVLVFMFQILLFPVGRYIKHRRHPSSELVPNILSAQTSGD